MSNNPQGSNAFATNYSGGGVGLRTADPAGQTSSYQMMQPGQYTPFQSPSWLQNGLTQSSMPIQNYPVQNYGRWNWQGGGYNGQGMGASGWPSPQSITSPYGMPQGGGYGGGYGAPQFPGTGGQMAGGAGIQQPGTYKEGKTAHTGGLNQPTGWAQPGNVQAAATAFGGMDPAAQAQFLQSNPQMQAAMVNQGLLSNSAINNLLGGSVYQSLSGQQLKGY